MHTASTRDTGNREQTFTESAAPFLEMFRRGARRNRAPLNMHYSLRLRSRKSAEPVAGRVAPGERVRLHRFNAIPVWVDLPRYSGHSAKRGT